ncbi:MAG: hypothetical protein KTQ13_00405 [Ferruginibacter sp.]|nr:hypothetical protein [Ferruginibacter sp.]MBU9935081.1 hypothetical protein [Ferruginibacter sp.]
MKKISLIKSITLFFIVMFVSASVLQCKKEGDIIKGLNRSFTGTADSTVFAAFYESNTVNPADATPDVNDVMKFRGVQTIIHEYCGTSNCHGGPIAPKFDTYTDIMKYVSPGSPESSKLWDYITTNDFDKAMPPVNSNHELNTTDKGIIYNWIRNGAKEKPNLADFRPAAIRMIVDGCASANCHSQATAAGGWARKGLVPGLTAGDTSQYVYVNPITGVATIYCQLTNKNLLDQVWTSYKDSVKKFYSDTVAFASFRPYKTYTTPVSSQSTRGPLQSYDDIILDILYPKSVRSNSSVQYTDPVTLKQYYAKGDYLNSNDNFIRRMDSTLIYHNVRTGVAQSKNGSMAYDDGGAKPSEIALIKAWYFADPNIPAVWKYGPTNAGIFKYIKSGNFIKP